MKKMISPDIAGVLTYLAPDGEFSGPITGDIEADYKTVQWVGPGSKPPFAKVKEVFDQTPSWEEYQAFQQSLYESLEYQRLRQPEYPPISDLADAMYWKEQGDDSKMKAYVAACKAVKDKYPKPK